MAKKPKPAKPSKSVKAKKTKQLNAKVKGEGAAAKIAKLFFGGK
jgi:hypothetical protein